MKRLLCENLEVGNVELGSHWGKAVYDCLKYVVSLSGVWNTGSGPQICTSSLVDDVELYSCWNVRETCWVPSATCGGLV